MTSLAEIRSQYPQYSDLSDIENRYVDYKGLFKIESFKVNDYLFNAKANTLPRYEGSRVKQQYINRWTNGDISPNKSPSIQSLKTSVAYSTTVVDQAPIKMNTSKAIVKYYIDEVGNIITPNVDKNSIYIAQGNFPSGENLAVRV